LITEKRAIFETNMLTKDQEEIPVEINSQILDLDGKASLIFIAREIRERKELEETKKQILKDTLELIKIKSDIILWVFYELKTPLVDTENLIHTMYDQTKYQALLNPDEMAKQFSILLKNIQDILNQITEFLNLSEEESQKVNLDFDTTDLKQFMDEIIKLIKISSQKPIQIEIKGEDQQISIDQSRIQHVFITLLSFMFDNMGFETPLEISWYLQETQTGKEVIIKLQKKMEKGSEFFLDKHPETDISIKICKNILLRHAGLCQYHINPETQDFIFELHFPKSDDLKND